MESVLWQTLITQTPGTAAVIIVVVLFLRSIKERDALFLEQMRGLTEELHKIKEIVIQHDTKVAEGMESMYRAQQKPKPRKKPTG